jgi:DNA-binding PucR family transcriptional regulator
LLIPGSEGIIWAWLGGWRRIDPLELDLIASSPSPQTSLAVGEPAQGLAGWRQTHRQARATWPIALRSSERVVRYAGNALLASALQDDLLTASLREQYLAPLLGERDGGEKFRSTLRAYFSADRNISSAAAILRVSARTVHDRLRAIEERLGRPLSVSLPEIETALRLQDFDVHLG